MERRCTTIQRASEASYTTDMKIDPYTYGTVKTKNEVHAIGEIWATMLIEVYAALVRKYGFSADFCNPDQTEGNIVFLHLIVDALPLQPCSPTFVSARDGKVLLAIKKKAKLLQSFLSDYSRRPEPVSRGKQVLTLECIRQAWFGTLSS